MRSYLDELLTAFRDAAKTAGELGNYFEQLIHTCLRFETIYADERP